MAKVDCSDQWHALRICSADRASGTSSDFYVYSVAEDLQGVWGLYSATIPNTVYTIDSRNNTVYFHENGADKTATITSGNYTTATLPAAVASAMTTASSGFNTYSGTLNSSTQKMTLSAGSNFSLNFGTNSSASARIPMGFSAADTTAGTSQTSDQIMNLAVPLSFNILINGCTGTSTTKGNGASFVVQNDQNTMGIVNYTGKKRLQEVEFSQPVKNLRIQLLSDRQESLNLNGADWTCTLLKLKDYSKYPA